MTDRNRMSEKRVLVTGADTGIGRGIAEEMAAQGAEVVLHYSRSDEGARAAVANIEQAGGHATAIRADFRDLEAVKTLAKQATDVLGGCDILINNAGITNNMPFDQITLEHFETLINVNLRA